MLPTKKYLNISQHWGSKTGQRQEDGTFNYTNPVSDVKSKLTDINDLIALIRFHEWSDQGTYYSFSDTIKNHWGMEIYQVESDGSLVFLSANYDTSD